MLPATVAIAEGIQDAFVQNVEQLMKPTTSPVLVLDDQGDIEVILHAIRGLDGMLLKMNVDLEGAKLIRTTLSHADL